MDTPYKPPQGRRPSVSAAASKVAVAKTPLERMYQVTELSARGRLIERLAAHGRANESRRSR